MTNHGRSTYVSWSNTNVLELLEFSGFSATTDSNEITPYGSAYRQYAPGMIDYGSISMTVSTDQINEVVRLRRAYTDRLTSKLSIVTPLGFRYTFDGFMTNFTHVLDRNSVYTIQITVKLTGKPDVDLFSPFTIIPLHDSTILRGGSYGLFLSPSGSGGNSGGEGALWSIKPLASGSYDPQTKIAGNTLVISPTEAKTSITVQARWISEGGLPSTPVEAQYTIAKPMASAVAITNFKQTMEINDNATDNVTATFNATVYPSGADTAVEWKIADAESTTPVPTDALTIEKTTGLVTIKGGAGGYRNTYELKDGKDTPHQFSVTVSTTTEGTVTDIQFFTIILKHVGE